MTDRRPDRRVERTRRALREALLALMEERGYDAVSVADIAERADVGRSTFYAHFADKQDLLLDGIARLQAWLEEAATREGEAAHPALAFVRPMIAHAGDNRGLFRALVGRGGATVVLEEIRAMLTAHVRVALGGRATIARPAPDPEEAVAEGLVGAFLALLGWWLERDTTLDGAALEAAFTALVLPGLRARGA